MRDHPGSSDPTGRFEAAGWTDTGPVRTANEDHWFVDHALGAYVVADGMGGHQAGEVAAQLAVAEVAADLAASADPSFTWPLGRDAMAGRTANRVRHAFCRANEAVFAAGAADPSLTGMGTTLTALVVDGTEAAVGSVGDSRAYLVRGQEAQQLTRDDTWLVSVLGKDGARDAAARSHPMRHVLTRVIGARETGEPEVVGVALAPGDVVVLATDGLHNVVDDHRIGLLADGTAPDLAARRLVDEAVANGTTDNVTVVVVRHR
ncbi:MAG: PP2C family serine/threonine-protein phosphatase [Vicinamibacterales bacterium]